MVLGVHKKTSRLAILGELSRNPLLLKALSQCLKYDWSLSNKATQNSLVALAYSEMQEMADSGIDCWLSKVRKIKSLLGFRDIQSHHSPDTVGKKITNFLCSQFESFWLREVNTIKLGNDGGDHNKLRFYKLFKGCFKREPYLDLVTNRNQRASLTRLRVSSHQLRIETWRYTRPSPTPVNDQLCLFCCDKMIDNESHFILSCSTFKTKRQCFFNKLATLVPNFLNLNNNDKLATILCPISAKAAKLANRFIRFMFQSRRKIEEDSLLHS